ncbi:Nucleic acid-binding, OB-fold [Sesbania bispinosa]|nr:Nucleic acid-binding, OB-fold [Sesbania bispinosa]
MSSLAKPNDPFALQMVFIDEEGGRIEATVPKHLIMKFSQAVAEGEVYRLSNFGTTANSGKFRAVNHEYKLVFNGATKLVPCPSVTIPLSGLSLLKTSDINKTNGSSNFLLDFMGVLTTVSEELTMNKQGRETRMMLLDLVDEMGSIRCAIFGDTVEVVAGFLTLPRDGLPSLNGSRCQVGIQNVMNATKFYWNPTLPEAIEFKNGLAGHEIETEVAIGSISERSRQVSMKEEFLFIYPRKSVGKLSLTNEDGCSIVLGVIDEVLQEDHWWYMACTCMKALSFDYTLPYCRDCNKVLFEINPRFKIKLLVTNGDNCVQFIMWDSECFSLLNKTCRQLLSEIKGDPTECYPSEIMDLTGQEFLFRVERKNDPMFAFDESYIVRRVCTDPSVIEEFKSGVEEETLSKNKLLLLSPNWEVAKQVLVCLTFHLNATLWLLTLMLAKNHAPHPQINLRRALLNIKGKVRQ